MSNQNGFDKEKWLMHIEDWDQCEPFPKMATSRFFDAEILSSLEIARRQLEEQGYECEIIYDVREMEGALAQLTVKKANITDYIKFATSDFVLISIVRSDRGMQQNHADFSMKRFVKDSDYSFVKDYVSEFLNFLKKRNKSAL